MPLFGCTFLFTAENDIQTTAPSTPAPATSTAANRTVYREQLEQFSFSAPKRRRADPSPTAPPAHVLTAPTLHPAPPVGSAGAQADVEEFLNQLKYKPPPT